MTVVRSFNFNDNLKTSAHLVDSQMANRLAILILRIRPLQPSRHTQVIEPIERERRIGFQHNTIIVRGLAADIQENFEREEIQAL